MKRPFSHRFLWLSLGALALSTPGSSFAQTAERRLTLEDLAALVDVRDPRVSPDGAWVAYVVTTTDLEEDRRSSDLWMVGWEGLETVQLTYTKGESESHPRWSPDGRYLAFLAARGEKEDEKSQIWFLNRSGGEAHKLTQFDGGVTDFAWSPDGKRLAVIASDPDPDETPGKEETKKKTPRPIVIDRYQFKRDRTGYLEHLRDHLYLVEVETQTAELLTPGDFDEALPSWSPDGSTIAFSAKRGPDPDRHENWDIYLIEARPGATARQLTRFEGADNDPSWGTPAAWSPDGKSIAYLKGGPPKYSSYDMPQLALIPVTGGEPRLVLPDLDRPVFDICFSEDGAYLYFLIEDDRSCYAARTSATGGPVEKLTPAQVVVASLSLGSGDKWAVLASRPHEPREIMAVEATDLRPLSTHNRKLLEQVELGPVEGIVFKSADGAEVHAMLIKPPDYEPGKRYPTIAYIHGGPVGQDGYEFDSIWQILAAHGYVVVAPNYRGSSGRGTAYTRVIYADWGNLEVQDVLAAVDYLVAEGIADPDRLGIGGWSYGAMTTNYTIAKDPRFKAAVSGAGISNMLAGYGTDQYIRQYENELGLPWKSIDTYLKVSFPFFHADRIRTPTLFLCGEKDFNVPLLNSEQMYQALRSRDVPTQLVIYPGQYHGLGKPSYLRDRLERYLAWFGKYLKDEEQKRPTGNP